MLFMRLQLLLFSQKSFLRNISMLTRSMKRSANGTDDKKPVKLEKLVKSVKNQKSETIPSSTAASSQSKIHFENSGAEKKDIAVGSVTGRKFIGAHVSIAGGLHNAPLNASSMGAKSFGLFLRSQRQWASKPLQDETVEQFCKECDVHGFTPNVILPHGSYLLNCGAPNEEILKKSRAAIVDELQRCEKLGLTLYNFHPGSTCGQITVDECLDRIGETINIAHEKTKYVITVVENMCRQGNTIGGDFNELRGIIDRVKDKTRIGVCIDTCHAFAAGYDVSTKDGLDKMVLEFDSVIGLRYLKAFHLNDSKGNLGCRLDRHENIGKGFIGKEGFKRIVNDPRFDDLPMILETPYSGDDDYAKEIRLLYSYVN